MKSAYRLAACGVALSALMAAGAAIGAEKPRFGDWGVDLSTGDPSVKPGDDFFDHVNGRWFAATEVRPDQPMAGVGMDLVLQTQTQLRTIIEDNSGRAKTVGGAKAQALYRAFMDEARVEALDAAPLQPELARIRAAGGRAELTELMGASNGSLGSSLYHLGVIPDAKAPTRQVLTLLQGGLGLPNRDYYLEARFAPQRAAYLAYVARTLKLIGWGGDADEHAKAIVAFETRVAQGSWSVADRRDPNKTYNAMSAAELQALTPDFDWAAYFRGAGVTGVSRVIVFEKSAFPKLDEAFKDTPLDTLKAWEAFHLADQASPYLSKRFLDSKFEFGKTLSGLQAIPPRWMRAVGLANSVLGEALGQEYVARYFPPAAKAKAEAMVANLKLAMQHRIERADWMAPSTKAAALDKLANLRVKVGYPDKWRDYAALTIDPADLYGDVERASAFAWRHELGKLDQPVDRGQWLMSPQTVDAYNNPRGNEIVFPAAALQPPFFDPNADAAVNYGAIGGVIGHEITHGFDDQGRHFDATGSLRDWWTPADGSRFEAEAAKLVAQYGAFEPVPGMHINGRQTLGENIADLGGLLLALDAYHASLDGKPAPVIGGLSGDQRVLLGWAQGWRDKVRDDATKVMLASDVHSPPRYRVNGPVRNIDTWYSAFKVEPGDKLYLKPEDRARIW
jgi:putative endopeptidase